MKHFFTLLLAFSINFLYAQNEQLDNILKDVKRDSTDKTCQLLFDDFYESFESDAGIGNPRIITATMNQYKYKTDISVVNRQLVLILQKYMDSLSDPKTAIYWLKCLEEEYIKVYGKVHPLILLYQGESLINSKNKAEVHKHFIDFQKRFPKSTMALVYIYKTEEDENLAKTWLSILKAERPTHWIVKKL